MSHFVRRKTPRCLFGEFAHSWSIHRSGHTVRGKFKAELLVERDGLGVEVVHAQFQGGGALFAGPLFRGAHQSLARSAVLAGGCDSDLFYRAKQARGEDGQRGRVAQQQVDEANRVTVHLGQEEGFGRRVENGIGSVFEPRVPFRLGRKAKQVRFVVYVQGVQFAVQGC